MVVWGSIIALKQLDFMVVHLLSVILDKPTHLGLVSQPVGGPMSRVQADQWYLNPAPTLTYVYVFTHTTG